MAINKVIDRNGNTLIDLTNDTINPNKVLEGVEFHGPDGNTYMGAVPANELDALKYTFIDYDGTILYTYTDAELDALNLLPNGADHTEDNLTFQGWNWTLEELKAWDRTRPDRPIVGAHYITTDGITYITITTDPDSNKLTEVLAFGKTDFYGANPLLRVEWGDGAQEEVSVSGNKSVPHTYSLTNNRYTIQIIPIENVDNLLLGASSSPSGRHQGYSVESVKLGLIKTLSKYNKAQYSHIKKINIPINTRVEHMEYTLDIRAVTISKTSTLYNSNGGCFSNCTNLEWVSLPADITIIPQNSFAYCRGLKHITLPTGLTEMANSAFRECISLKELSLPNTLKSIGSSSFYFCYSLSRMSIPDSVTTLGSEIFSNCSNLSQISFSKNITSLTSGMFSSCYNLTYVTIPDNIQSISSNCFSNIYGIRLDLSQQTKLITLTGSIMASSSDRIKLLVPAGLLDQYKSASYWSNYASRMVGV